MDHTSGSSLESSSIPAGESVFATPTYAGAAGDHGGRFAAGHVENDGADGGAESGATAHRDLPESTGPSPPDFAATTKGDTDAIEFRVIRPGAPVRRLRLTGNRYTFGSAEGCSIRLSDPALRPMHAVLIRDEARILIRAYSVPIQINGARTTEATLQVGDVLRLGAYQFELLSTIKSQAAQFRSRFSSSPRSVFDSPESSYEPASRRRESTAGRTSRGELPSAEDILWRERLRREIDQWRDRQSECDRRENRCDEREADLRGRESELWSRAESLYRRESRLQSQEAAAFQLYDEFNQRQEELLRLREETQLRQHSFQQREAEFRTQELEYRSRLDEATRQLQQSQQQAETATEAVGRMREQFESLNRQIEELSRQQEEIETREQRQRDEHQQLRLDLETARDQAVDARAESEVRRDEAEARVAEMTAQIESLQSGQGSLAQDQRAKLEESERIAEQLREHVAELQKSVAEAGEESARLRSDYAEACESVRRLESLVSQSSERGDRDRQSWAAEADELRAAVDQLSIQLAQANSELSDLREANHDLSSRLEEMQNERDQARADAQSRPSSEDFQSLRHELDAANDQLAGMKSDYEETLTKLDQAQRDAAEEDSRASATAIATAAMATQLPTESDHPSSEPDEEASLAETNYEWHAKSVSPDEPSSVESTATWDAAESSSDESSSDESELTSEPEAVVSDSVWDQPDSASDWEVESAESIEATDDFASGQESDPDSVVDSSVWGDSAESDPENASVWQSDAPSAADDSSQDGSESLWDAEPEGTLSEPAPWAAAPRSPEDDRSPEDELPAAELPEDKLPEDKLPEDKLPEDKLPAPDLSDEEPADEQNSIEVTSVWEEPGPVMDAQQEDVQQESDAWPQDGALAESDPGDPSDGEADNSDSLIDGSLASMLIKDLEADAEDEQEEPERHDGTYVMDGQPGAASWDSAASWDDGPSWENAAEDEQVDHAADSEAESWDREHVEEGLASRWSNDPEGYRVEQIDDEGPLDELAGDSAHEPRSDDGAQYDASSAGDEPESEDAASEPAPEPMADIVDDDSIEAYMNRLLQRSQGESGSESRQPETVSVSTSTSQTGSFISEPRSEAENENDDPSAHEPIDPDAPLVPRSQAPEKNSGLTAMRELANASARSAISRSVRIQTRNIQIQGMVSFACASGALICGLVLFLFLPSVVPDIARLVGAAMTIIVALIYIKEGLGHFREAKERMVAAEQGLPDPAAETEPPTEADLEAEDSTRV